LDPTRLLLTFGADKSIRDEHEGNTALHWAILSNNAVATTLLVDKGSPLDARNNHGESIYGLARRMNIVNHRLQAKMNENAGAGALANARTKRWKRTVMLSIPFVGLCAAGLVFQAGVDYLLKIGILMALYIGGWMVWKVVFDRKTLDEIPVTVYIATKVSSA
jgi:palmitoyltransferase